MSEVRAGRVWMGRGVEHGGAKSLGARRNYGHDGSDEVKLRDMH